LVEHQPELPSWDKFLHVHHEIHDRHTRNQLQEDLIEHKWALTKTVEVYKWIVLALSISLDFWLRWLVHEA
jgi:hypothetical protein